jgi:hypothetical protein
MIENISEYKVSIPILFIIGFLFWIALPTEAGLGVKIITPFIVVAVWFCFLTRTKNCDKPVCVIDSVFVQVILGFEHKTAQGVAHHGVLMIGLFLEWMILYFTLTEMIQSQEGVVINTVINIIIILIISCLILHQILIFRNFSIKEFSAQNNLAQSNSTPEWRRKCIWFVTFLIFIGIGAVAGEFGYLFAVSKLSHLGGDITGALTNFMGTNREQLLVRNGAMEGEYLQILALKQSLKGIFILGAIVVCSLVLIWDGLVKPDLRYKNVWSYFIWMDSLSLLIWLLISTFIIPSFAFSNMNIAKLLLLVLVLTYTYFTGKRLLKGYIKLKGTTGHTSEIAL